VYVCGESFVMGGFQLDGVLGGILYRYHVGRAQPQKGELWAAR